MKKEKIRALLFDMDGVLVDVSGSYRTAIKQTAEFFTKIEVSFEEIQSYKERVGFNNDWDLTEALICAKGKKVDKKNIIDKFQEFYLGKNFEGLIQNEKWVLNKNLLAALSEKYAVGIVTGRPREEAEYALRINDTSKFFPVLIAMEDVKKGKPDPEGILKALSIMKTKSAVYFGDTKSDEVAALTAGIDFKMINNESKKNINEIAKRYLNESNKR